MDSEELNKLASQFISLWQENFAKAMADPKIIESMMGATGNMQQFYDKFPAQQPFKPSAAADTGAYGAGADELHWQQLHSKIDELERRLAKLEKPARPAGKRGGSGSKK